MTGYAVCSPIFLFLFLPITLLRYFLSFKSLKNYWLLLASLIFFARGGVSLALTEPDNRAWFRQ